MENRSFWLLEISTFIHSTTTNMCIVFIMCQAQRIDLYEENSRAQLVCSVVERWPMSQEVRV